MRRPFYPILPLLSLLLPLGPACSDKGEVDDTGGADTASDTGETGETGETGDSTETGETGEDTGERLAVEHRFGIATVLDGVFSGTETWTLVSDDDDGLTLCLITYSLLSSVARADCTDCSWAFDLIVGDAAIAEETDGACSILGYDDTTVYSLNGTVLPYGYAPDYYGHAQVLMTDRGTGWAAATFASYDETTGEFTYDWELGSHSW